MIMINLMLFVGTILVFLLALYYVFWQLWLALESGVSTNFQTWNNIPEAIRRPKFWQFAILAFWLTARSTRK